jgi:hypothetical protein
MPTNDAHECDETSRMCAACKTWYCDKCKAIYHPVCPRLDQASNTTTYAEPVKIVYHPFARLAL